MVEVWKEHHGNTTGSLFLLLFHLIVAYQLFENNLSNFLFWNESSDLSCSPLGTILLVFQFMKISFDVPIIDLFQGTSGVIVTVLVHYYLMQCPSAVSSFKLKTLSFKNFIIYNFRLVSFFGILSNYSPFESN